MLNFPINKALAELLLSHKVQTGKRLLDVVVAADVDREAMEILQRKGGKLRLITNPELAGLNQKSLDAARRFRYVRGGLLAQDNYTFILDLKSTDLAKHGDATDNQEKDLLIAWAIGSTSNSNTITLVKDGMLIGNGVGQQDRVSAAELAIKRAHDAGHKTNATAAYSDSFFPFPDGPQVLADAGITAILTSSGSVGDQSIIDTLEKSKVVLYMILDAIARGFYAH